MLLRLGFSQALVLKLVADQGIDSSYTLASLSDEDITNICNMIQWPGGLASSRKAPNRWDQISVLAAKNLKLLMFMFKMMEHCSQDYVVRNINSTSVLHYQHQWKQEQKKTDNVKVPKVDKNNWAKPMEHIVLHIKLVRGIKGSMLAYVVWHNFKIAHILPGSDAYLNLDEDMIARAPFVDARLNLNMTQEMLDRA